ncbi:MAG: hypothetical protein FJ138_18545, partial [Deltaproteobacteria bacterium]|nr:hypothetical protein [Deltaproteobacteria bacterium]
MSPPLTLVLLGEHIAHSRSPALHAALAQERGLDLRYHLLPSPPEGLDDALAAARALGARGASVTSPHKRLAADRCARLTPQAAALGAANALRWRDGALEGHNTDLEGARLTLRALLGASQLGASPSAPLAGRAVGVLGAAGAAAAACFAALDLGAARLVALSRREGEGRAFARWLAAAHPRGAEARVEWRSAATLPLTPPPPPPPR